MDNITLTYKNLEDRLFNSLKGHFYEFETVGSLLSLIFLKYVNETNGRFSSKTYFIPDTAQWELINEDKNLITATLNVALQSFSDANNLINKPFVFNFDKFLHNSNVLIEVIDILSITKLAQIGIKLIDIFDSILYRYSSSYVKSYSLSQPPDEIIRLLVSFVPEKENVKVYNPFAGLATLSARLPEGISFFGQESLIDIWQLGNLRLLADESGNNIEYICENSIINWLPSKKNIKFDFIVGIPGFRIRLNKNETDAYGGDQLFYESYLIDQTIDSLQKKGKAAICTSRSILFASGREKSLRMKLIERDVLESIIILPENLLANTSISLAVFVLNTNKKLKGKIRFIDGSNNVVIKGQESKIDIDTLIRIINTNESNKNVQCISHEEIIENDYHLDMHRYRIPEIHLEEDAEFRTLNQLLNVNKRVRITKNTSGKFIRVRDLSDDPIKYEKTFDNVEYGEIPIHGAKLFKDSMLFSLRWKTLKPTYFNGDDKDVYYSYSDIFACKVKNDIIDNEYLVNELYEQYVLDQIEAYRMGSTVPYISAKNLLKIKIKLPALKNRSHYYDSLKEQKSKVKGIKQVALKSRLKELKLESYINDIKKRQLEDLRIKKHRISQDLNNVKSSLDSLITFMKLQNGTLHASEIINPNQGITVEKRFERMKESLKTAINFVENITNDLDFGKSVKIDLNEIIKECVERGIQKDNVKINVLVDEESFKFFEDDEFYVAADVKFSKEGFSEIYNNILENAISHGFIDNNKNYEFNIHLRLDQNKRNVIISFQNNGLPFPKDMAERYKIKGEKAGHYANNGIGSWKINAIVEHFKGKVEVFDHRDEEFPVKIDIILPLYTITL